MDGNRRVNPSTVGSSVGPEDRDDQCPEVQSKCGFDVQLDGQMGSRPSFLRLFRLVEVSVVRWAGRSGAV